MRKILILMLTIGLIFTSGCEKQNNTNTSEQSSNTNNLKTSTQLNTNKTDSDNNNSNDTDSAKNASDGTGVERDSIELSRVEHIDNNKGNNTKSEPWLFGEKDLYINNKPVLNSTYAQLIKDFGNPKTIKKFKVNPPATEEDFYNYFKVLVYNGLECELDLGEEDREQTGTDEVFRFDITNNQVELNCGLKVGMTTDDILSKYGERKIYNIDGTDADSEQIKLVLKSYKPDGYYSKYFQAMIIYSDQDKFDEPIAKALILLIKNSKVDRIVFCYPSAD